MNKSMDMTRGRIVPHLLRFGMPLMITDILQQLYTLCDSVIVGRLIGVEAFAAVGAAYFLHWMPLSMITAMTHGFGAVMAQRFGAGDVAGWKRAWRYSVLWGIAAAVLLGGIGLIFLEKLLSAMRTPAEMTDYAVRYLRVLFAGLPLSAVYNVAGAHLRAAGDSRTPLKAMVISTTVNIALDFVLVSFFGMGVTGVALGTVLAQLVALAVCIVRLKTRPVVLPPPVEGEESAPVCRQLLKLGLPPFLQDGVTAIGGLFVQTMINGFGVAFVAGLTAANRYTTVLRMCGGALEGAAATFVGQNVGAGKMERAYEGTGTAAKLGLATSLVTAAAAAVFARPLIVLLVGEADPEVIRCGMIALRTAGAFLPALYMLCLYRASLQSMGDSLTPVLSGFTEFAMRLFSVLVLAAVIGRVAAYIAEGLGCVAAMILLMSVYYRRKRKWASAEET